MPAIWKSRHRHLDIGIGIDVGISIDIAKLYFALRSFIFAFQSFLWSKTPMFKSFSSTLADLPRSFSCCLSSYSVQNSLAPASGERNSTVDVILGVLKTRQVDGGSSRVCKFLIKKTVRDHFLEIFCKLQSTFKKFDKEFVFSSVQTLYCKSATLVKRRLLKISRRATFRNIPCTC